MGSEDVGEDRRQHDDAQQSKTNHRAAVLAKRGGEGGERRGLRQNLRALLLGVRQRYISGHGEFSD